MYSPGWYWVRSEETGDYEVVRVGHDQALPAGYRFPTRIPPKPVCSHMGHLYGYVAKLDSGLKGRDKAQWSNVPLVSRRTELINAVQDLLRSMINWRRNNPTDGWWW